jgi:hypothetical protein
MSDQMVNHAPASSRASTTISLISKGRSNKVTLAGRGGTGMAGLPFFATMAFCLIEDGKMVERGRESCFAISEIACFAASAAARPIAVPVESQSTCPGITLVRYHTRTRHRRDR